MNVSKALASEGVSRFSEVLSFSESYDKKNFTKVRFGTPWGRSELRPYESIGDIAFRMRRDGNRYFVFDELTPAAVRGVSAFWPFDREEMKILFDHVASWDSIQLYRLKDLPAEDVLLSSIEKAKTLFELYDLDKAAFAKGDSSRAKAALDEKRKRMLSERTPKPLLDGIHFVDYQWKREKADRKGFPDYYNLSLIFWAEKQPEKDYAVQWHGHVDEEHAKMLPELIAREPLVKVPWSGNNVMGSFRGPAKADWNKGDYIVVTARMYWPELPYDLYLALAPYGGGTCSPFINLGWTEAPVRP